MSEEGKEKKKKKDSDIKEEKEKDQEQQDVVAEGGTPESESTPEGATKKKVKGGKNIPSGIAFIHSTFNNTKVTITDLHGNVVCWGTAGKAGFKGSKKSTAYVAQLVATETAKRAQTFGMRECEVRINGPGAGRESAIRGIVASGIEVTTLKDITPVPHNGCRPPKRRRV